MSLGTLNTRNAWDSASAMLSKLRGGGGGSSLCRLPSRTSVFAHRSSVKRIAAQTDREGEE